MNYKRRDFLKIMGQTAVASSVCGLKRSFGVYKQKPNIIFIMADDLGIGDLGCYGQKLIKTPQIDRLAKEGMRFTQCYSGSAVCAPARSVLMTGQHSGHTRVRNNFAKVGGIEVTDNGPLQRRAGLEPEDITIAQVLKKAGYVTGMTGKWGIAEPGTAGTPNKKGFDEWFGYLNQRRAHTYYPEYLWRNETKELLEGNKNGKQQQYTHDLFTDFALKFIEKHHRQNFFLYLPYTIPHPKLEVPSLEPYAEMPWKDDCKRWAAMITRMDTDIGRIMNLLKKLKIDDNTIVFFCSDNGGYDKGTGEFFGSTSDFRGTKGNLYEGGLRVPMVVRYPGHVPAGKISHQTWYFADVLPTLAELANVKPPTNIDGVSIVPTLSGQKQNLSDRFLYWEFYSPHFSQAVRWQNFKAIRTKKQKPLELYNLTEDIGEKNDVADKHPEIIKKIEEYLRSARTDSKHWPI